MFFAQPFNRLFSSVEEEYKPEIDDINAAFEKKKERKQALIGIVVSTKNLKSIIVKVAHERYDSKYNHRYMRSRRIMAHDEKEESKLGDVVRIGPCRPMSKKKRHSLMDIIRRPAYVTWEDGTVISSAGNLASSASVNYGKNRIIF